jgi:hypothetical protein
MAVFLHVFWDLQKEISLYIVRTFVNAAMYPHPAQQ